MTATRALLILSGVPQVAKGFQSSHRHKRGGGLSRPQSASPKFHELSLRAPSSAQAAFEVRLPDGTCVSGSDAEALARLVGLLRG